MGRGEIRQKLCSSQKSLEGDFPICLRNIKNSHSFEAMLSLGRWDHGPNWIQLKMRRMDERPWNDLIPMQIPAKNGFNHGFQVGPAPPKKPLNDLIPMKIPANFNRAVKVVERISSIHSRSGRWYVSPSKVISPQPLICSMDVDKRQTRVGLPVRRASPVDGKAPPFSGFPVSIPHRAASREPPQI